jgi:hypothetical protein
MINRILTSAIPLILLVSLFTVLPEQVFSQNSITFDEGLAVPVSHTYSRTAVHYDKIEWQLIHGEFETPEAGQTLGYNANGDTLRWYPVEVNDEGRFAGRQCDRAISTSVLNRMKTR